MRRVCWPPSFRKSFHLFFSSLQIFGQRWSTVAEHMPGRLAKQCRERYLNNLDPELRRGAWSREVRKSSAVCIRGVNFGFDHGVRGAASRYVRRNLLRFCAAVGIPNTNNSCLCRNNLALFSVHGAPPHLLMTSMWCCNCNVDSLFCVSQEDIMSTCKVATNFRCFCQSFCLSANRFYFPVCCTVAGGREAAAAARAAEQELRQDR